MINYAYKQVARLGKLGILAVALLTCSASLTFGQTWQPSTDSNLQWEYNNNRFNVNVTDGGLTNLSYSDQSTFSLNFSSQNSPFSFPSSWYNSSPLLDMLSAIGVPVASYVDDYGETINTFSVNDQDVLNIAAYLCPDGFLVVEASVPPSLGLTNPIKPPDDGTMGVSGITNAADNILNKVLPLAIAAVALVILVFVANQIKSNQRAEARHDWQFRRDFHAQNMKQSSEYRQSYKSFKSKNK